MLLQAFTSFCATSNKQIFWFLITENCIFWHCRGRGPMVLCSWSVMGFLKSCNFPGVLIVGFIQLQGEITAFQFPSVPFVIKVSSESCILQLNSFCKASTKKLPPLIPHCSLIAYVGNALQNFSYCFVLRCKYENNVFKHFSTDVQGMSLTSCTLKKWIWNIWWISDIVMQLYILFLF